MKNRYTKKQAKRIAILWTIGAIIWFFNIFRSDGGDFLQVVAAVLFTVDAVVWWRRWYYCEEEIKNQEEQNHE